MKITGKAGGAISYTINPGEAPEMLSFDDLVERSGKSREQISQGILDNAIPVAGQRNGKPYFYRNAEAAARSSIYVVPGQPVQTKHINPSNLNLR